MDDICDTILKWYKGTKYYYIQCAPNLFGSMDLLCVWGREGTKLGGSKIIPIKNEQNLKKEIDTITKRRKTRGYVPSLVRNIY
jgi:predicted DNA-binding WGR domain protein